MNHLYYGDNLSVLRASIADESVDLIYLDPPFNSNANYSYLFKDEEGNTSGAQIKAFDDTWHWDDMVSGQALAEVRDSSYQNAAAMLDAMMGFLGKNPMTAYLCMMAVRLIELHRVLKPTGSLYLHCDPTASHYLKILLDAVFGTGNFRNEIVWKRTSAHSDAKTVGRVHDIILRFTKSDKFIWNKSFQPYDQEYILSHYRRKDSAGRLYRTDNTTAGGLSGGGYEYEWNGVSKIWRYPKERMQELHNAGRLHYTKSGTPEYIRYLDEMPGIPLGDVWTDIPPLNSQAQERLGYQTQKPVALLERILNASSSPGDVVLDPFCGCGTTVHAAQKLGRRWIGIDITHLAINLIETRLFDAFGDKAAFTVHGVPSDLAAARALFERDDATKKEFEKWALSLIKAHPQADGKKGADGGVDGFFRFGPGNAHRAIVSVKGGTKVDVKMVRELDAVVTRQKGDIGVLMTLNDPTSQARDWARAAGTFTVEGFDPVPRLQIVTIKEALETRSRAVQAPLRQGSAYKRAPREEDRGAQGQLGL